MGLEYEQRVLVVDDEPLMGTMVGELLSCMGFEPQVFNQSVLAAEALEKEKFGVLVTDWMMPDKNGLELAEEATALDPKIGIVLMTGIREDLNGEIETLRKEGVHIELLPKPFDIGTLLSMVNKVRQPVPAA